MIMNLNGFYSNGGKEEKGLKYFQRKYSYMCLIHKKCEFGVSLNLLDDNLRKLNPCILYHIQYCGNFHSRPTWTQVYASHKKASFATYHALCLVGASATRENGHNSSIDQKYRFQTIRKPRLLSKLCFLRFFANVCFQMNKSRKKGCIKHKFAYLRKSIIWIHSL